MSAGSKIREFRKMNGLTQKQLSELTGIAEITIRQYEAEKYNPKMQNLIKISDVFNVPVAALLDLSQDDQLLNILHSVPSATIKNIDGKQHIDLFNVKELTPYFTLNSKGKKKALSYIEDLSKLPEYTEDEPPTPE